MAFTIEDVRDLARLLKEHPEWRAELQRLLQAEELAIVPSALRAVAEAQQRAEATLGRISQALAQVVEVQRRNDEQIAQLVQAQQHTEAQLAETRRQLEQQLAATRQYVDEKFAQLAEAQRQAEAQIAQQVASHNQLTARVDDLARRLEQLTARVDQLTARVDDLARRLEQLTARVDQLTARVDDLTRRLEQLTARVDQLTARVDDLTRRLEQLTARVDQLTAQVEQLTRSVRVLQDQMGEVRGRLLEMEYRDKAHAFFGTLLRRVRVVESDDPIWDTLEDRLEADEVQQVLRLDLLLRGRLRGAQEAAEVWLAVEVSTTIDERDIARAAQRAALLRKAGFRAIPVVAGVQLADDSASDKADRERVVVLLDGIARGWTEALTQ